VLRKMEAAEIFQRIKRRPACRHGGVKVCGDRFCVCCCIYTCENLHKGVCVCVRVCACVQEQNMLVLSPCTNR